MSDLTLEKSNMLPEQWITTSIDSISDIILGQSPPSSTYNKEKNGLPFFQGKAEFGILYPTPKIWCDKPKKLAEKNDILLSVRAPVGTTNLCPEKSCIGRGLAAIRPKGEIPVRFILYFLRQIEHDLERQGTGTTFTAISGNQIKSINIPLPPLNEQKRIVSKIEELFSIVDAITQNLEKIKIQIEQLKTIILSYSFEHNDTIEWKEVSMTDAVQIIDYRGRTPEYSDYGIPHIRSNNVKDGKIVWNKIKYVSEKTYEKYMTRGIPKRGDLLLTTEAPLGEVALVPEDKFSLAQRLVILRPIEHDSNFLLYQIMSPNFHARLNGKKTGTTVTGISSRNLKPMKILTTNLNAQKILADNIETKFSKLINLAMIVEKLLQIMERIKRVILKSAFEGNLEPQDPNEEPAEILLQKIKQEKTKGYQS